MSVEKEITLEIDGHKLTGWLHYTDDNVTYWADDGDHCTLELSILVEIEQADLRAWLDKAFGVE